MRVAALWFALLTTAPMIARADAGTRPLVLDSETAPSPSPESAAAPAQLAPLTFRQPQPRTHRGAALLASGYSMLATLTALDIAFATTLLVTGCGEVCVDMSAVGWLFVPVVGPVAFGVDERSAWAMPVLTVDAFLQASAVASILLGHVMSGHRHAARNVARVSWALIPVAPGAMAGMSLTLRTF